MENEVKELEAFAAVVYASNLDTELENMRASIPQSEIKGSTRVGASNDVGEDEMLESQLEGAWSKVMGATG
jgi:hypothetical protein